MDFTKEGESPQPMPIKNRVREILEVAHTGDRASRWFDRFLISLISINVIALVLGTMNELFDAAPQAFDLINTVSVAIFTVEYLLRVWSCTADPRYSGSIKGRLRFMLSPLMVIDLLSILPFFVLLVYDQQALDLRAFRAVRLVARAARLTRYSPGFHTLAAVIEARKYELITVVAVLAVMLVLAASLMYFVEKEAQPEKFASIPAAMWWSIVTLTTVGYGDVAPVTVPGRIIAGLIAILGIGFFALPAGILGSSFLEQIQRRQHETRICPHCGEEIHE